MALLTMHKGDEEVYIESDEKAAWEELGYKDGAKKPAPVKPSDKNAADKNDDKGDK